CAVRALRGQAANQPLAARPHRFHRAARAGHCLRPRAGRARLAAEGAGQALGQPGATGGRPRRRVGSAGRGGADGDAPARPAQPVRAAQGADPGPGHHRRIHARLHRRPRPAGGRQAAAVGAVAGGLHRPRGAARARSLSTAVARQRRKVPAKVPSIEVDGSELPPLGMPPADFLRDYWQKRPLLVRNAFPGFESPLSPEDLAGLACEELALSRIVMHDRERDRWQLRTGPFPEELFPTLPHHDWTLLVQDVDKWDADVAALLPQFGFLPRWRIDDVMVSFAAPGGSVGAHVDQYDVFLLQAQGHRRWQIDAGDNPPLAFRDDVELKLLREFHPTHDWVLGPGDMLYLPPGVPHHGVAEDACLTFSVGMRAPSAAELLGDYVDTLAAEADEALRYRDPD